jgi:fatty acid desaturase 6
MEPARGATPGDDAAEALLGDLERLVQDVVRASSWWERHGVDCAILALSLFALPAGEGQRDGATGGWAPRWDRV